MTLKCASVLLIILVAVALGRKTPRIHSPEILGGVRRQGNERIVEIAIGKYTPPEEKDQQFWIDMAQKEVNKRLRKPNLNKAKNIIMFLGDGMSLTTVTSARILKGQRKGNTGEEDSLSFEKFPYAGLSKTYCSNAQVPDSACTATAYLCGVKTNIMNIGVSAEVMFNNCSASMNPANHVSSIAAWAQEAGMSTGFVTTTTLTHASPAATYAHVANRFWENDRDVTSYTDGAVDPEHCIDMARQLVTQAPGRNFEVMFGGGMGKFLPDTLVDMHGNKGERADGRNLLSTWQGMHPKGLIVTNRDQLLNVNVSQVTNIMGLFKSGLMDFHSKADPREQPTLAEMTKVAIQMLSKNRKGFFLFVEGGLIDYGNHLTTPGISLDETIEMSKAVEVALKLTNEKDTLIVTTSDHAHPLSIAGYPGRGNGILDLNQYDVDANGVKYTTLNYAVGPEQYLDAQGNRIDLSPIIDQPLLTFPSYIKNSMGVHAGDDVGIFASGPQSHLFSGVLQQNTIPHLMAYAACIGNGRKLCDDHQQWGIK